MTGQRIVLGLTIAAVTALTISLAEGSGRAPGKPGPRPAPAAAPGAVSGPTGNVLWGLRDAVLFSSPAQLYTIDPASGAATFVANVGDEEFSFGVGLTFLGDLLYGSDLSNVPGGPPGAATASIDRETGDPLFVTDQEGSTDWEGLASNDGAGVLYSMSAASGVLEQITPGGTVTTIGGSGIAAAGMAYDDAAGVLYAVDEATALLSTIDTTTGSATTVGPLGIVLISGTGLAFDEATRTLYLTANNRLYTVSATTGAATQVGPTGVSGINGLAWEGAPDVCGSCPCPGDINRDGLVNVGDIIALLSGWGPCPSTPSPPVGPLNGLVGLASRSVGTPAVVYRMDPTTGEALEAITLNGDALSAGLSFLDGTLFGSNLTNYPGFDDFDTGTIAADGTISFVSDQDFSTNWAGLAANETQGVLYTVDNDEPGRPLKAMMADGTIEVIGITDLTFVSGLAYDDANGILYAVQSDDALVTIDVGTAAVAQRGFLDVDTGSRAGLAYDEVNQTLYMNVGSGADGDTLYTVDVETALTTLVGPNGTIGIDGLAWTEADFCGSCPCASDVTRDGVVDVGDIIALLAGWGPCN